MSSTPLLLLLLAQFPQTAPPLASPAIVAPAAPRLPIAVSGRPVLAWRGGDWILVWKDVRRATSPLGPANLFFTSWDGGVEVEFPGGVPLGGPPMPVAWDDLFVASTQQDTFLAYAVPGGDSGVLLLGRATDGGTAFGPPFVVSQTPTVALPTVAGSAGGVLAAWYAAPAVHLYQWPTGARAVLDAGPNVLGLSAGEADGGFLVSWFGPGTSATVTLVSPTTLMPIRTEVVGSSGLARVQVVGTPSARIVTTSTAGTTSATAIHSFNGSTWSLTNVQSLTIGSEPVLSTASTTALFTTYATTSGRYATVSPLHRPMTSSGQYLLPPDTLRNVAIDDDGISAVVLARSGNEVFVQRLGADLSSMTAPTLSSEAPRSVLHAPATQRSPSAAWFDPLSTFVVAWDEERADGGYALMTSFLSPDGTMTNAAPLMTTTSQLGFRPVLLRRPDGSAHAVQVNLGTSARSVYLLGFDGGLSLGQSLTTARSLTHAIMGNQATLQWGPFGVNTSGWVGNEANSRFDLPGRSPSCAAWLNGSFWLAVATDAGITWAEVDDGLAVTTTQLDTSQVPSSICTAASATPQALVLTWRTSPGFAVGTASVVGGPITRGSVLSRSDNVSVGPFAAPVRSGDLVAWITEGPPAVNALVVQAGSVLGPVVLGRAEPATLSVTSSPAGVGLVLWEAFDADAGARRVELRLIDVPDAGTRDAGSATSDGGAVDAGGPVDAGADAGVDGGAPDAGSPDGGNDPDGGPPADAGADGGGLIDAGSGATPDAGSSDAGDGADGGGLVDAGPSLDAGAADGGPVFVFVPATCGCGASPGGWLVLSALGVLGLARRRTRGARSAR